MLIDGEKYACDSCIKGHRVSGCQHHDRKLHHINPKGRPVKQCEHCRGARKSKAHHAKCECGDKKDAKGNDLPCSCHHGKQCVCGTKKASELKVDTSRVSKSKPRLSAALSESAISYLTGGSHKPFHRLNHPHHGATYMIPRAHTIPNHSKNSSMSSGTPFFGDHCAENMPYPLSDGEVTTDLVIDPRGHFPNHSADALDYQTLVYSPSRLDGISSQNGSPVEPFSGASGQVPLHHWPLHNYTPPATATFPIEEMNMSPNVDFVQTPEHEWSSIPSAGLDAWSAVDLPIVSKQLNNPLTKATSHSGDSNPNSVPTLTSSPGIPSETGENGPFAEIDALHINHMPGDQSMFDKSHKISDRRYNGVSHDLSRPPTSEPEANNRQSWNMDYQRPRASTGMSYFLDSHQTQKDIPRTEPLAFSSSTSPDMASLQSLAIQSDYSSISPDHKPTNLYFSQEDQHSPNLRRFELNGPIGLPMDHVEGAQGLAGTYPEWTRYAAH